MESGLILVNTGPGKGKTTAALGTTLRALGHGYKVAFLQFIKSQATGESQFLEQYALAHPGRLNYQLLGLGFVGKNPDEKDKSQAALALDIASQLLTADYDLVVLDEICVAMDKGLIEVDQVITSLNNRSPQTDVILTGRGCPEKIIALAHTVTEMLMVKHAYTQGIEARQGLEF